MCRRWCSSQWGEGYLHILIMLRAFFSRVIPPRLRSLLVGGEEISIESSLERTVLLDKIRQSMDGLLEFSERASGYTLGSTIRVGWRSSWFRRDAFEPVFYGHVQSSGSGSVIVGRISGSYFTRVFMWIWTGGIVLFSLVFIWTIIFPLAGWALLWVAEGIMALSDSSHPSRENRIVEHLRTVSQSGAIDSEDE